MDISTEADFKPNVDLNELRLNTFEARSTSFGYFALKVIEHFVPCAYITNSNFNLVFSEA
jgi:hypothetical protein